MMKNSISRLAAQAITALAVLAAIYAARQIWIYYQYAPWTPDGRVRADIVQIAPDVSGIVTQVAAHNDQRVKKGELLFQIDRDRYELTLKESEAALAAQRVKVEQLRREAARNRNLMELVATEVREQTEARLTEAEANLSMATSKRDLARLNLQRTRVLAPTDGILSDLNLHVGNYAAAGKPVMALIDTTSFRVEGYFEESKLKTISINQPATIQLMGERRTLKGHVSSVAAGIEDRDRSNGSNLLPNVNPTFSWVRLAQRVPVRIALDDPSDPILVAGRTATVTISQGHEDGEKKP